MQQMNTMPIQSVDYEEGYHSARHNNHSEGAYYDARAQIALKKFFSGIDHQDRVLDFGCGLGQNIMNMPNAVGYDISKSINSKSSYKSLINNYKSHFFQKSDIKYSNTKLFKFIERHFCSLLLTKT